MMCNRCGYTEAKSDSLLADVEVMLDHIRLMHPDDYEEPERWPDGSLVVTVAPDSLTPENITEWPAAQPGDCGDAAAGEGSQACVQGPRSAEHGRTGPGDHR